jgi:hypothetical protein
VPLDRQIDYLTLAGRKLAVPFEVKVVLSTNLDPASLGDEAFFRRIHNKVYVGCLDDEQFDWVLARVASAKRVELTEDAAAHLRRRARAAGDGELRAYLPGVVCKLALAICRYENTAPKLSPALVDRGARPVLRSYRRAVGEAGESPGRPRRTGCAALGVASRARRRALWRCTLSDGGSGATARPTS